jgi:hypothetical protein
VDDEADVGGGNILEHRPQFARFVGVARRVADHGEAPCFGPDRVGKE